MTVDVAMRWLETADRIGNRQQARPWNSSDVEAVHVLERHLRDCERVEDPARG